MKRFSKRSGSEIMKKYPSRLATPSFGERLAENLVLRWIPGLLKKLGVSNRDARRVSAAFGYIAGAMIIPSVPVVFAGLLVAGLSLLTYSAVPLFISIAAIRLTVGYITFGMRAMAAAGDVAVGMELGSDHFSSGFRLHCLPQKNTAANLFNKTTGPDTPTGNAKPGFDANKMR